MDKATRPYIICHMVPSVIGTPSLFDAKEGQGPTRPLKLVSMEKRKGDMLWVRYKVKHG